MKGFHKALAAFWKGVAVGATENLPAYLDGYTPDDVQFPFIKFDAGEANGLSTKNLYAWVWVQDAMDGTDAREQLATLTDLIEAKIPQEGTMITWPDGYAILERNDNFVTPQTDPTDSTVIGGRFSYTVRFYYY